MEMGKVKKDGRSTLYKPEYVEALIEHMSDGRPFETFGAKVGVSRRTLYAWCENNAPFQQAKEVGFEMGLHWWLEQGRENLIVDNTGRFNTGVWVFSLKALYKIRDGSESKASEENPVGKTKDQLEEYKKEIEKLREALEIRSLRFAVNNK